MCGYFFQREEEIIYIWRCAARRGQMLLRPCGCRRSNGAERSKHGAVCTSVPKVSEQSAPICSCNNSPPPKLPPPCPPVLCPPQAGPHWVPVLADENAPFFFQTVGIKGLNALLASVDQPGPLYSLSPRAGAMSPRNIITRCLHVPSVLLLQLRLPSPAPSLCPRLILHPRSSSFPILSPLYFWKQFV